MRDTKLRLSFLGILLIAIQLNLCHGLCSLVNGTVARCHDLDDVKYIDTYNLGTLKTSIAGNSLQSEIFRNLSSLRHLELTHGQLQHIDPGTFRQLRELRSLDLSDNKIEHLDETAFDGLIKLRSLSLRKNALKKIPTAVLNLKNLMVFEIAGNPLDCSCETLKIRDALVSRGVHLSKKILCTSPANLKGKQLVFPDIKVICMFENQDQEMQMDQPIVEGSGEVSSGDPFDDITTDEFDEHEQEMPNVTVTSAPEEVETPAPTESSHVDDLIIPAEGYTDATHLSPSSITAAPVEKATSTDEEMFFSEESDKHISTSPVSVISTESTEEITTTNEMDKKSLLRQPAITVEGSGAEEDLNEGSGIDGSGAGVPPISWDVPEDETDTESSSTTPVKEDGWFSLFWDTIAGTSAPPEDDTSKDLDLQEEEFISASTERAHTSPSPVEEKQIVPVFMDKNEQATGVNTKTMEVDDDLVDIGHSLDESKSGQVKAEAESTVQGADASPARQPQKGMGSYVVLAVLLGVLGALIGFAAYKGEFCTKKRKRNDVEGGTELKDMTKSLLDAGNGTQPKIASNGNLENVPLVCSLPLDDPSVCQKESGTYPDGSQMRYSAVPDVVDPVKPPRKSFPAQDDSEKALTNGRSHQDLVNSAAPATDVCLRTNNPVEPAINGKNHHDSVSSLGTDSRGSPSARTSPPESIPTNGSLGNLQGYARPPVSPGAQRVKITLQENPDSLPKTPILITRTKAGENLVKTP